MSAPSTAATELAHLLRARRDRLPRRTWACRRNRAGGRRVCGARRWRNSPLADLLRLPRQGRDLRPSRQVLDALAQALRTAPAERDYLHVLVHGGPPAARALPAEALAPASASCSTTSTRIPAM